MGRPARRGLNAAASIRKYLPYAFTEHGAIMAATHGDLAKRLDELEHKTEALSLSHDNFRRNTRNQIKQVFHARRELTTPPEPYKRPIGFVTPENKGTKGEQEARPDTGAIYSI